MNRKRRLTAGLLIGACALSMHVSSAHADPVDDAFARGQKLAKDGRIADAEAAFEEAWAGRKSWDIAGNLGLTEAELGKWEEAAEHLDYAVTHIGGLATPTQRKALTERLELAKSKVGVVSVNSPRVVTVKVGARTQRSDQPFFLSPGTHKLECSEGGYDSTTVEVTVVGGRAEKVVIELKKTGDTVRPVGPVKPNDEPRPMWPAIVLGVAGGVFLVGGVGSLVGAITMRGDAEDAATGKDCNLDSSICTDIDSTLSTANTLGALSFVGLGLGAGALTALAIYIALPDASSGTESGAGVSLHVRGTFLSVEGAF